MATKLHSAVSAGARHPIHQLTYPDAANRIAGTNEGTGATPKTFDVAKQDDDNSLWLLTNTVGPTWDQIMTSGASGIQLDDDEQLKFGTSADAAFVFSTAQATSNAMLYTVDAASKLAVFTDISNILKDHDHAAQTNPTLFIHSATDPDTDNTQWISLTHDQSNARIASGKGAIIVEDVALFELGARVNDSNYIYCGTGYDSVIGYSTVQTNDSLIIGVSDSGSAGDFSRAIIVCEEGDIGFDFAHAAQTNPTLFIHSANQATDEWISLTHDQTDAVIASGKGAVKFEDEVILNGIGDVTVLSLKRSGTNYFRMAPYVDDGAHFALAENSGANNQHLIITNNANLLKDHDHETLSTNPTVFIHSATDPDSDNTQWLSLAHNQTDAIKGIGSGSKLTNHEAPTELAVDGSYDLPDASSGFGRITAGDSAHYTDFYWTEAAGVTLVNNTANVAATDTGASSGDLCIFDNGTTVRITNRTVAALKIMFDLNYSTSMV